MPSTSFATALPIYSSMSITISDSMIRIGTVIGTGTGGERASRYQDNFKPYKPDCILG